VLTKLLISLDDLKQGYTGPNGGSACIDCAPGKYKEAAGSAVCDSCGAGKYSGQIRATTSMACMACPENSVSPDGSDQVEDCLCKAGQCLCVDSKIYIRDHAHQLLKYSDNFSLSQTFNTYQGMSETTAILVLPVSLANSKRTSVQIHVIIVRWAPTHRFPVQRQSTRAQIAPRFLPRSRGKEVLPVTATLDTLVLTSARASHANKENSRTSPALLPAQTVLLTPTCVSLAPALQAPACLAHQDQIPCLAAPP